MLRRLRKNWAPAVVAAIISIGLGTLAVGTATADDPYADRLCVYYHGRTSEGLSLECFYGGRTAMSFPERLPAYYVDTVKHKGWFETEQSGRHDFGENQSFNLNDEIVTRIYFDY
ncbi:hypothetical protein ACQP2U_02200 [Nocardia sp. CA-084685]|uniref:hypothetical protein n=1 Tax=Nocardia sp. CA-084685 TaxID=3239970 RepID=UPI003D982A2F